MPVDTFNGGSQNKQKYGDKIPELRKEKSYGDYKCVKTFLGLDPPIVPSVTKAKARAKAGARTRYHS